jgi:hypothetical protein
MLKAQQAVAKAVCRAWCTKRTPALGAQQLLHVMSQVAYVIIP